MICVECGKVRTERSNKHCNTCRLKPTRRERTIIRGLIAGKSNKIIGYDIAATESVVQSQLYKMFRKFKADNRTHLAVLVLREHPEWLTES